MQAIRPSPDVPAEVPPRGALARAFAFVVAGPAGPLIIPLWIAAAVLAVLYLPPFGTSGGGFADLTPTDAPAIKAERTAYRLFKVPAISRVAIVQRDPAGLSDAVRRQTVTSAVNVDRGVARPPAGVLGAFPLVNDPRAMPGAGERDTTAITYLFFDPALDWAAQIRQAHRYASSFLTAPGSSVVGVTGSIPGRVAQEDEIAGKMDYVEIATIILVALIVALTFGSVLAPVVTLVSGLVAYLVASHVLGWAGQRFGFSPPAELDPLMVVLLLGIVTDYAIFFLSGMRSQVEAGQTRARAARAATAQFAPTILTAGLMVAAGTAALTAATQRSFREFGPGLSIAVLIGLLVAVTLVPALMRLFGGALFWPRRIGARDGAPAAARRADAAPSSWARARARIAHLSTHRVTALIVSLACVAVLVAGASGLRLTRFGLDYIISLPSSHEAHKAATAAGDGFAPGIIAPTEIILQKAGIATRLGALASLEDAIGRRPGVAGVIGPREQPQGSSVTPALSSDGNAARYVVVFKGDPLGADGIGQYDSLRSAMPSLVARAGLQGAVVQYAGDTALASDTIDRTTSDLLRVAVVVAILDLVLLMLFLRTLFAPFYLLAASILALAAALGVTTYLFQSVLGGEDLTYYVPFAASVLLISLGSDYNIFIVGRIWDERRVRPLRSAIERAVPSARRPISMAAIALALSFAMLAIVNLSSFRQLAFLLAAGVLIDSFFVRSLLVPSLVALFGRTRLEEAEDLAPMEADVVHDGKAA